MKVNHELAIMSAVADSMIGESEPIKGAGCISATGRLMRRLEHRGGQEAARQMWNEGLLYLDGDVLTLDIDKARQRVKHLLFVVESKHPSVKMSMESMCDLIYRLMDKVTAALTKFPTVTTYRYAAS